MSSIASSFAFVLHNFNFIKTVPHLFLAQNMTTLSLQALRAKQKAVREQHAPNLAQMLMWKDLQSLLAYKRDTIIMRQQSQDQEREEAQGENMLIL